MTNLLVFLSEKQIKHLLILRFFSFYLPFYLSISLCLSDNTNNNYRIAVTILNTQKLVLQMLHLSSLVILIGKHLKPAFSQLKNFKSSRPDTLFFFSFITSPKNFGKVNFSGCAIEVGTITALISGTVVVLHCGRVYDAL